MCTLTAITVCPTTFVVMNRDEQRSRATALLPREIVVDSVRVLMPIDPVSNGTWIAATSVGLVFAILNLNLTPAPHCSFSLSRGSIIPRLVGSPTFDVAISTAQRLAIDELPPFRLAIIGVQDIALLSASADGHPLHVQHHSLGEPLLLSSSGLGDHVVAGRRRTLFDRLLTAPRSAWPASQQRFHAHRWTDCPACSVHMSRADARTVSRVSIERTPQFIAMTYEAEVNDAFGPPTTIRTLLTTAGVREPCA